MTLAIPEGRKTPLQMQVDFSDPDLLMKLPGAVVGFVKSADPQRLGNGTFKGRYHQIGVSLEQDLMKYIKRAGADKIRLGTVLEIIDRYLELTPKPGQKDLVESLKRGKTENPFTPRPNAPVVNPDIPDPWDEGPLYTKRPAPRDPKNPSLYLYDWTSHQWEEPMTPLVLYPHHFQGKAMDEVYVEVTQALWRLNREAASMFFAEVKEWLWECDTPTWHEFVLLISQYAYIYPHPSGSGASSSSAVDPHRPPF